MKVSPLFKEQFENYESRLEKDGFVTFPFMEKEMVESVKQVYDPSYVDSNQEFFSTSFLKNLELKRSLNQQLHELLSEKLGEYFSNYRVLGCAFLTKQPGQNSAMPLHQDWTVVDETRYGSFTIWVPLDDTTKENGAIECVPGSHKYSSAIRAPGLPITFKNIYSALNAYKELLPLKKGNAFMFNHALIHGSVPNKTESPRLALAIGVVPKDADLHMYYPGESENEVIKYRMPDEMFIRFPEIVPEPQIGEYIDKFQYSVPLLTIEDLHEQRYYYRKNYSIMKKLFLDESQHNFFEENGYTKFPLLDNEEVKELRSFYDELGLKDEMGYGFHVGMDNPDKEVVAKMMDKIYNIVMPKLKPHIVDAKVFTVSYVVKDPNPMGLVPPHQDWTFVEDEKQHCSVTCWIPLQDVNMDNGCLGVIKGSNKFFDNIRASPAPQVPTPLKKHKDAILPYLDLIDMQAGEAFFWDNRTIHASPPNITDSPRIAIGIGFTQQEAEVRHYYLKPGTDDTLQKYEIDADFFKKYDNNQLSKMYEEGKEIEDYKLLEEVPLTFDDLTTEQFIQRIRESGNEYNEDLVQRMGELFGTKDQTSADQESEETDEVEQSEDPDKQVQQQEEEVAETVEEVDGRTFWEVYTPMNILREIKYRLSGK